MEGNLATYIYFANWSIFARGKYKVVGFLAMLELVKKGALHVLQKKNFSNINIEHHETTRTKN